MTATPKLYTDVATLNALIQEDAEDTTWMDDWSDWHDRQLAERFGKEPPLN